MFRHALLISVALVCATVAPAIAKGMLFELPLVSGSTETVAFGINDSGTVTGLYLDSNGVEHGFVGPDNGSNYSSFDDSTAPDTQGRGISPDGHITGIANALSGDASTYIPFERTPKGAITDVTRNGMTLNYLIQGINSKDIFTGNYENSSLQYIGHVGKNAKYASSIKLNGIDNTGVAGRDIDDAGDIVGWYLDAGGNEHGFLLSRGKATTIDHPGGATTLEGINNKGTISGLYTDTSGNRHGFTYDIKTRKFHEIAVPGSTFVEVWGLNDQGLVALDGENSDGVFVGYIYCPSSKNCPTAVAANHPRLPVLHHIVPHLPLLTP
ncbi:MAG: hypothetical protein ACREHV_00605 [Rhizomicrobium sp.]